MSDYNLTKIVTGKRLELFLQAKTIDDRQKLRNDCLRKVRFATVMEAGKIARRVKKRDKKDKKRKKENDSENSRIWAQKRRGRHHDDDGA